jgi:hypothetical protein
VTTLVLNRRKIRNAERIVQKKFELFRYAWYDAVVTSRDEIDPIDFAVTIAMNSRATATRMRQFMLHKDALDGLLRGVPHDLDLSPGTPDAAFDAVRLLFEEACKADGTKLSVASKVLHRKRPRLIPMLDRVVVDHHYWPAVQTLAKSRSTKQPAWFMPNWQKWVDRSDPTVYMHVMAEEIHQNADAIREIRRYVSRDLLPAGASDVRIVEAALYSDIQGMGHIEN